MKKNQTMLPMVEQDEWLHPVAEKVEERHNRYLGRLQHIEQQASSIVDYANGYRFYGWQYDEMLCGWWFREWLPEAYDVFIFGDFNSKMKDETYVEKFPYVPTEEVVLSNVRTASGKPLGVSPNEWMFRNTKIVRK